MISFAISICELPVEAPDLPGVAAVPLEPTRRVEDLPHDVRWPAESVRLSSEDQEFCRNTATLQRRVQFLRLRQPGAQIGVAYNQERRRLHICDVHHRRSLEPR